MNPQRQDEAQMKRRRQGISRAKALRDFDLPEGVPGDGPTDLVEAVQLAAKTYKAKPAPTKRFWQL